MEDENNNQVNNQGISEEGDQITLYVRAGCDNRKYGACPFCQRIFMFLMLKSEQGGKRQIPDSRQSNYPLLLCDMVAARFFLPHAHELHDNQMNLDKLKALTSVMIITLNLLSEKFKLPRGV